MTDQVKESWHLDKKVPITLIIALIIQGIGLVWWSATINNRVEVLEARAVKAESALNDLSAMRARLDVVYEQQRHMDGKLDRLIENQSRRK